MNREEKSMGIIQRSFEIEERIAKAYPLEDRKNQFVKNTLDIAKQSQNQFEKMN